MPALRGLSLRRTLLLGILVPVLGFVVINALSLYQQALQAADVAYDRTLLASAKSIGELLEVGLEDGKPRLRSTLLYSSLEAFEADNRSRMFYKVSGFDHEMLSGYAALPPPRAPSGQRSAYAALVEFYDDHYQGEPIRMAVLLQPVSGIDGLGMATVQVAETLELRQQLARQLLVQTLWRHGLLLLLIAAVVVLVVQHATRPVRALSARLQARSETDLSPLPQGDAPRELQPIVEATNGLLQRLAQLLEHQKRFVRDASHQLRTPLAVLKTQLQSARRGDLPPEQALQEISATVEGATQLANQMLALAKIEQLRQQHDAVSVDWAPIVRAVALEVSVLIGAKGIDFELRTEPAWVRAHEWALRELARNLLHNAIRHSPNGGALTVTVSATDGAARLSVSDGGPGIDAAYRPHLFQPFAVGASSPLGGSGLGLAICHEIVQSLGGRIDLDNRTQEGRVVGLDAVVQLPKVTP